MDNSIIEMIDLLISYLDGLKNELEEDMLLDEASVRLVGAAEALQKIQKLASRNIIEEYNEYFEGIILFYNQCTDVYFLDNNLQDAYDSVVLLKTCLKEMRKKVEVNLGKCVCCGSTVEYIPLSNYYVEMKKRYGANLDGQSETLNKDKYTCPNCGSSDRDRLIISFLKNIGLPTAPEGTRVLQIAPAKTIDLWIKKWCPNVEYDTTDLFMEGVTYKSDIQDMNCVDSGVYDVIICSHVLEHVQDDRKAMTELKRILKDDGEIIFLVPVDLKREEIDEEWGLSEEENWRRFGQGDHCRAYSKKGLINRLEEQYYVHQLGKDYFGEEIFKNCGLTDTSILYVLTKDSKQDLYKGWIPEIDQELCQNGPLVSVILPCYNHEKYVARAIESIINQSYKNIEIIVCDDGSSDDTPNIMKQYSDHFAKEYYFKENLRARSAFLAEEANGKYIALAHSDDYWDKDKIALQVEYLEKNDGICLTWADYVDDDNNEIPDAIFYKKNRSREEWLRYLWENGNCLCNPSSMMKKEVFLEGQTHGYSCKQLPDYFKWIDKIQKYEINIVQLPLTKMGIHYNGPQANDSAPTAENVLRTTIEDGIHWMKVLEDMEDELFITTFNLFFKNKEARTKEELMCEKYFLMRDSGKIVRENSAVYYMALNYPYLSECLLNKYNYTRNDFLKDEVEKGLIKAFLSN